MTVVIVAVLVLIAFAGIVFRDGGGIGDDDGRQF